jgi:hypothetical protein
MDGGWTPSSWRALFTTVSCFFRRAEGLESAWCRLMNAAGVIDYCRGCVHVSTTWLASTSRRTALHRRAARAGLSGPDVCMADRCCDPTWLTSNRSDPLRKTPLAPAAVPSVFPSARLSMHYSCTRPSRVALCATGGDVDLPSTAGSHKLVLLRRQHRGAVQLGCCKLQRWFQRS